MDGGFLMFEQDYMQRIIKGIGQVIIGIFIGKSAVENNINQDNHDLRISEDELLEFMIKRYISDGKINEAENMLFEAIESNKSQKNLEISLFFYNEINKWNEDKLIKYNFSKYEIKEGLKDIKKLYDGQLN